MLARLLVIGGYQVLQARNGVAAREDPSTGEADLIVSDVMMPGYSGVELRRWLAANHATVPVILISGYSPFAPAEFAAISPRTWFLSKPFETHNFLQLVADILAGAEGNEQVA